MLYRIKTEISHIWHRIKTWVSYKDVWNLDDHINSVIYEWLIKFKEDNDWCPTSLTVEQWNKIIDKMIKWYWLLLEEDKPSSITNEAELLFKKYKHYLWI